MKITKASSYPRDLAEKVEASEWLLPFGASVDLQQRYRIAVIAVISLWGFQYARQGTHTGILSSQGSGAGPVPSRLP